MLVDLWRPGTENFFRKMGRPSMSAPSSLSSKRKRIAASTILASLFCACAAFGPAQGQSPFSRQDASIPNFSPSSTVGWLKAGVGDEFLSPDTGPGPVVSDPAHGYGGNFLLATGNAKPFKIADLTNPVLQPWVVEKMRKTALTLMSGTVTADQTTKTTVQLAIDQFDECAESLFKDDFDPAEVDYELSLNKEAVLFLSAKWRSHDGTINILTRIRSIGSTVIREMTMTQNGASNDELPPPAANVK
jgi:hypothetical protein